jgi:hypothetical protein
MPEIPLRTCTLNHPASRFRTVSNGLRGGQGIPIGIDYQETDIFSKTRQRLKIQKTYREAITSNRASAAFVR